jgi:hypothetical protein
MSHAGITAVLAKGKSQKQKVKKVKRERERFESAFHKFSFRFLACFFFLSNKRHEQKNSTGKPPLNK